MQYVYVGPEYICATDAHKMVWQKSDWPEELQQFIEEKGYLLVHSEQWKKISGKNIRFLDVGKHALVFHDLKKDCKVFVEWEYEGSVGRYPEWQSVLPVDLKTGKTKVEPKQLGAIGFNPRFLADIADVWGYGKGRGYRMDFFGGNRAILVTVNDADHEEAPHWQQQGAVLMPDLLTRKSWIQ